MKKIINRVGFIALVGIFVGVIGIFAQKTYATPSQIVIQDQATATTSVAYLIPGTATSTYQIDSNGAYVAGQVPNMQQIDAITMMVQFTASTSASVLTITPQWSNNNIDWYGFNSTTNATPGANGVGLLASTTLVYQWQPGNTIASTTGEAINLPVVSAEHERVIFGATVGNGSEYAEFDLKKLPTNP